MPNGTYADEDPNAGVVERASNSVKKIVSDVAQLAEPRSVAHAKARNDADEASTEGQVPANVLGRMKAGQSTDSNNQYVY